MAIFARTDRRDHRDHAGTGQCIDDGTIDLRRFAHETEIDHPFDIAVGIARGAGQLGCGDEVCVLAGQAHRLAARRIDPADQLLVDRAGQHHFGNLRGRGIGDAQAIDELAFDACAFQHRADLRPAAMHHHRIDADRLQQHDILGKGARQIGIAHRVAAIFHHEGAAGIGLQIGQRLGQRFGLLQHGGIVRHRSGFPSSQRPSFTAPTIRKGTTTIDSVTLASIWPSSSSQMGNTP